MAHRDDMIALARVTERDANRERRAGNLEAAAEQYDRAREMYADSGAAFYSGIAKTDELRKLARDVQASIERCNAKASNCRHPRPVRAAAPLPAPCCLQCGKRLRRASEHVERHRKGVDGQPGAWGNYGDNVLCGQLCGYRFARSIAIKLHEQGRLDGLRYKEQNRG